MLPADPLSRVLYVDLTRRRHRVVDRQDLFSTGLGGASVAIALLAEQCPPGADPMSPANPIVLATGPLVGLFPLASKTVAMFKSPHTGNLGESHAGGRSSVAIRSAGYGALVITGASPTPIYLVVDEDDVWYRDASALWGMTSSQTVGTVIRDRESGSGLRSIMRIGRAGENGVTYASVITETYRHFGRLGLGAVFGSKRLKGLVVSGRRQLPVSNPRDYRHVYDRIFQAATGSSLMKKYHNLGTSMNIAPLNALGALPTRNLSGARFEGVDALSGESLAEHYLGRRVACAHCPVACIHLAALRTAQPGEPYFYKTSMIGYDYEPIYSLGSMLGVSDAPGLLHLMDAAESHGVDVMSTGVTLAWATEALQRGLISLRETDGLKLAWGDHATYAQAMLRIVTQPNDFYRALARGAERASGQYGGRDFALCLGGNEMSGYHTGPAAYLTHMAGARHSHLDSAGYSLDEKAAKAGGSGLDPGAVGVALVEEERWRQVLTSLVVCLFARGVYDKETVLAALAVAGFPTNTEALTTLGAATLRAKHAFKAREGWKPGDLRVPARITETPSPLGTISESALRAGIHSYFDAL